MSRFHEASNRAVRRTKAGRSPFRSCRIKAVLRVSAHEFWAAIPDTMGGQERKPPDRAFLVIDIAGRHLWTGAGWLPVAEYDSALGQLLTREEAEAEVRRLRRTNCHARISTWSHWRR